eukprot:TRINITY_DN74478_c0_g1_i1.p1 TRINITY_DN74478_c0_g1~~TRINITY_DN74478_c0_g1_i1.p1  ORF type:complete len:729 (-),score=145.37 TRINITY_DN74478_c0_g1_i1:138-2324(-)
MAAAVAPSDVLPTTRRIDARDMKGASVVSDENGYYDSQNIIVAYDRHIRKRVISCVLHHSENHEGGEGLTLFHTRSEDDGKTWSELIPIEPEGAPQSHDGYQLLVGERIYLFYGCNHGSQPPNGLRLPRTDMQLEEGFWMKWSDDYGRSFSRDRVLIPVRRTAIDRANPWEGSTMGAFCCDKPQVIDNQVFFAFQKTRDGNGESYGSEVFLMRSKDLVAMHFTGEHPINASWETLPKGDRGIQTRRGLHLGEEPHVIQLAGKELLCFWRTELGILDSAISEDYGETWFHKGDPQPLCYGGAAPTKAVHENTALRFYSKLNETLADVSNSPLRASPVASPAAHGDALRDDAFPQNLEEYIASEEYRKIVLENHDIMRNPRGAITPYHMRDNYYCLIYYNNGFTDRMGYVGRLVYWLTVGKLFDVDGKKRIVWAQPELCLWWDGILLDNREDWNEDWAIVDGAGYADFQEVDGQMLLVESNKLTVRFHAVDRYLTNSLKMQLEDEINPTYVQDRVVCWDTTSETKSKGANAKKCLRAPVLPDLRAGRGFSLVCWVDLGAVFKSTEQVSLVTGLSTVSGALDEPGTTKITKGYEIFYTPEFGGQITMRMTDGFKLEFTFSVTGLKTQHVREHYGIHEDLENKEPTMLAITFDGGPKVTSCVINKKLYNGAPSGWKFFPRELGEIGGSSVVANPQGQPFVARYEVYDRALLTSEAIASALSRQRRAALMARL